MTRLHRAALLATIAVACIVTSWTRVASAGLPAGQHTAKPKYWSEGSWRVTNYTPFEFDRRIDSLTPGIDHDLWFSVGSSIEHIDSQKTLTTIRMPESQWIVSGIATTNHEAWFSAGQSGKIGIIAADHSVRFIQVVPRRNFPDLHDLVVNKFGEMWFVDVGRRSIGYRSSSGRVVENPFVPGTYPVRMVHCMGKLWVSAYNSYSSGGLNVIDESLRPQPYFIDLPKYAEIGDMACDASDRIWLAISDFRTGAFIGRFDAGGHFKRISLVGYEGGRLAADSAGGVWLSAYARQARLTLLHFDRHSAETTFYLPTVNGGEDPVTFDPDGRIWVGMNDAGSPVAVTELEPARVVK